MFNTNNLQLQSVYGEYTIDKSTVRGQDGYRPSLWEVRDQDSVLDTESRFQPTDQQLYEATVEAYGQGVFEGIPYSALKGMHVYVQHFMTFLGYSPIPELPLDRLIHIFLNYLDFYDIYFPFYDTVVQLTSNSRLCTYVVKHSGATLPPDSVEVFRVDPEWDYAPFRSFNDLSKLPQIQAYAKGEQVFRKDGQILTRRDILKVLCQPVLGSYESIECHMSETLHDYVYEEIVFSPHNESGVNLRDCSDMHEYVLESMMAASIAAAAYLKSPYALRLLTEFHPVYYEVLEWDYDRNVAKVRDGTGGECLVRGWEIYTHKTVYKQESVPPGTCRKCNQTLHCTKLLDANALIWKNCSCGTLLDPADLKRDSHKKPECQVAYEKIPPIPSFVCFRCMEGHLCYSNPADVPPQLKCTRVVCPNTECEHHLGEAHRVAALNQRRRHMLTHNG